MADKFDLYAHVTGYYTFAFGSTGLERTQNDVLAGTTPEQELRALPPLVLPYPAPLLLTRMTKTRKRMSRPPNKRLPNRRLPNRRLLNRSR